MGWSGTTVGGGVGDTGISIAELQAELAARNVTASRLDAILRMADGISALLTTTNATFTLVNNTNEQDVIEFIAPLLPIEIDLDMNALTQVNTVRIYEKVDGVNYRLVNPLIYPTEVPTGVKVVVINLRPKGRDMKITMQASVAEGANRSVPHTRRTGT